MQTDSEESVLCGTCGKKNLPEERRWQVAGVHLKPKRNSLKTHRTTLRTPKHKSHNTTPPRLVPSPHQTRTIQKNNFAKTPTTILYQSENLSDLILQLKFSCNNNNN